LKGNIIGVEGINSFSHIFILKILENSGISEGDVTFVDLPAMDVGIALNGGTIDAGHTWDPVKTQAIEDGYVVLASAGELPGLITDVLVFRKNIIDERQEDIQKIVKSMNMARDFVFSNPNEALEIMANAESMDVQSMSEGINGIVQPNLNQQYTSMQNHNTTSSLYATGKIFTDYYLQRGQINSNINLDEIIRSEFIDNLYQKST
jgi:NitT/TauT family transport system substrate-binding protein